MPWPSADAIANSARALQSGDVASAFAIRNAEFHHSLGDFDEATVQVVGFILNRTPALLADCALEVLGPLRVAAAMMELWGQNNICDFVTVEGELDYKFSIDAIANLLHSYGCFLSALEISAVWE